jgi:chitin synthase
VPGTYEPSIREDPEEATNIRYGRIPQRVPRRFKTMKKVE